MDMLHLKVKHRKVLAVEFYLNVDQDLVTPSTLLEIKTVGILGWWWQRSTEHLPEDYHTLSPLPVAPSVSTVGKPIKLYLEDVQLPDLTLYINTNFSWLSLSDQAYNL